MKKHINKFCIYRARPFAYETYLLIKFWILYSFCMIVGHNKKSIGFREMPDWVCRRCNYTCFPYQRIDKHEERFAKMRYLLKIN